MYELTGKYSPVSAIMHYWDQTGIFNNCSKVLIMTLAKLGLSYKQLYLRRKYFIIAIKTCNSLAYARRGSADEILTTYYILYIEAYELNKKTGELTI